MENKELQRRLLEQRRKYTARQVLPGFKDTLERVLGCDISRFDFLEVQAIEELLAAFSRKMAEDPTVRSKTCEASKVSEIWEEVADIALCVAGIDAVFFHSFGEYTAGVILPAGTVLANAEAIWEVLGGPYLRLITMDHASGFHLDRYMVAYPEKLVREYELRTWGVFAR